MVAMRVRAAITAAAVAVALASFGTATSSTAETLTIATAGDVCDPVPTTPDGGCVETASLVKNLAVDYVVETGDMQYENASPSLLANGYDAPGAWGDFKDATIPVIGNHEIKNISDASWCNYWGAKANCPTHQGRTDLGDWSVIALDTNGSITTAKRNEFKQLLAEAGTDNVIVAWHHPQYSPQCRGCHGPTTKVKAFMQIAVDEGVDVVLASHDHLVANFDRMGAAGPSANGIPVFVTGSGGAHPDEGCDNRPAGIRFCAGGEKTGLFGTRNDLSARSLTGVEVLTLGPDSFSARFVHADGTADGADYDQVTFQVRP